MRSKAEAFGYIAWVVQQETGLPWPLASLAMIAGVMLLFWALLLVLKWIDER